MAPVIGGMDNRRDLPGFLLKADFGVSERLTIYTYDISQWRKSAQRALRERNCEKKTDVESKTSGTLLQS
jgi:hypothetical protein